MEPASNDLIAFARRLADAARAETLSRFGAGLSASDKNEGGAFDPVTEADRAAERAMRALIAEHHPDHGVSGEEYGETVGTAPWRWSLDPIDGTRAFICGLPSWTTLIALLHEERPVIGVIDTPRLDELYLGAGHKGSLNGIALCVSGCTRIPEARLSTTDPNLFAGVDAEAFARVRGSARLTRYGLDAYAYARLAAGDLDLVIENGLKPHDYHALIPVVRSAGGVIGNWRGEDDFSDGAVVAAASQALFDAAVALLNG